MDMSIKKKSKERQAEDRQVIQIFRLSFGTERKKKTGRKKQTQKYKDISPQNPDVCTLGVSTVMLNNILYA